MKKAHPTTDNAIFDSIKSQDGNDIFDSSSWERNIIFDNHNHRYLDKFTIRGNALHYEEEDVKPNAILYCVEYFNSGMVYKTVAIDNLIVYAVKVIGPGLEVSERTIYFKCKNTGSMYELKGYVTHPNILRFNPYFWEIESDGPFFDSIYATKDTTTEAELKSDPNVYFFNTRYFKIDNLEKDYNW